MGVIGRPAPLWSGAAAQKGEEIKLKSEDFKGSWYVLFFYPLDFTFVCPTEIVAYDNLFEKFEAAGAKVVGCSVDSVHTHLAYTRTARTEAGVGALKFPLLSDLGKNIAAAFDVLHPDGLKALRATFIVDPDGIIQSATINNLSIGRNTAETLRTLKAAQQARELGDVCPADWEEGDELMKATLAGVAKTIN